MASAAANTAPIGSAAIGYAIFGIGHVFLLGVVTMIASFVPLVGTGLVWVPLVVGLFLAHHTRSASLPHPRCRSRWRAGAPRPIPSAVFTAREGC